MNLRDKKYESLKNYLNCQEEKEEFDKLDQDDIDHLIKAFDNDEAKVELVEF
jgi:response regulator of citrate/malate metabolism